jgi:hypothetical protein
MEEASVLAIPMPTGTDDRAQAESLARRYCAEFVDLKNFKIQHDLLRTVPVELMFRYNFVPIEQQQRRTGHCGFRSLAAHGSR